MCFRATINPVSFYFELVVTVLASEIIGNNNTLPCALPNTSSLYECYHAYMSTACVLTRECNDTEVNEEQAQSAKPSAYVTKLHV